MISFLDCEASSLRDASFPIEVAWVDQHGHGEQHLIRPAPAWLDSNGCPKDWSPEAERLHGLAFDHLLEHGAMHTVVASRVAECLGAPDVQVYSDAPTADGTWIGRVLLVAGLATPVPVLDIQQLYRQSCRRLLGLLPAGGVARQRAEQRIGNLSKEIIEAAEEAEHVAPGPRHRALPDAQRLWRTWRAVEQAVVRHGGDEPPR
jgi:hypothetical protein